MAGLFVLRKVHAKAQRERTKDAKNWFISRGERGEATTQQFLFAVAKS
jgi:hypothetical protein